MRRRAKSGLFALLRFFLALSFFGLASAKSTHAQGCSGVSTNTTGTVTWTPQWCQEFNGSVGSPDTTVWSFDLGNNGGWGNSEVEFYCGPPGYMNNPSQCPTTFSTTTNTAYIDGSGNLVIQPINNSGTWISTRMKTQGLENFRYGRIEARIQLPDTTNQGLWPAFWSLGSSFPSTPWPNCGEADIMEDWSPAIFSGPGPNGNRSTIHTAATGGTGKGGSFTFPSGQQATSFHTYGLIWSNNLMQFYVDTPTAPFFVITPSDLSSTDTWPFNAPLFLLANVAVGGTLGGSTANLVSPQPMLVDYVRQYTPSAVPAPNLGTLPSITVKAGATTGNSSNFTPALTSGTGFVYFSCSTNAPKASCGVSTSDALNPHVLNSSIAGENVTVTATTTANAGSLPLVDSPKLRFWIPTVIPGILLFALIAIFLRKRRPAFYRIYVCSAFLLATTFLSGCSSGTSTTPPPPGSGTTPGSYEITVNAFTESNTSGTPDATAQISLTVN